MEKTCGNCISGYYIDPSTATDINSPCQLITPQVCSHNCLLCERSSLNGENGNCISCLEGFYYSSGYCLPIDPKCTQAFGPTSTECYSCHADYDLAFSSCIQCDTTCLRGTCYSTTPNDCGSCPPSAPVYEGFCMKENSCHPKCLTCFGTGEKHCLTCRSDRTWYKNECFKCHHTCSLCSKDENENFCVQCAYSN